MIGKPNDDDNPTATMIDDRQTPKRQGQEGVAVAFISSQAWQRMIEA